MTSLQVLAKRLNNFHHLTPQELGLEKKLVRNIDS